MEKVEEILKNFKCKICFNAESNNFYPVKEMQFGLRDEFIYCHCSNCGCLQIVNPPADLAKFYPSNYFSFTAPKDKLLKEKLNVLRDRYAFGIKSFAGRLLYKKFGEPAYITWMKLAEVNLNSKIIDAGCGNGILLYRMGNAGFKNLLGIDPFIKEDIHYKNGVTVLKKDLSDIKGEFDLVMMHHSLEHMEDQHKIFGRLSELVAKGKKLLIRIPVCSSFAWETYKEHWMALDAPRHFYIHSYKSLELLAGKYDFKIYKVTYDSLSIQFWGSEQYNRDIPLYDERSYFVNPSNSIFTKNEIDLFEKKTAELNKNGRGDRAAFFLEKV